MAKVITRIVLDMQTGATLEEESFEYSGDWALCGGGGGGKSKPSAPPPPEPEPLPESEKEAEAASVRDTERNKLKRQRGFAGTILTSPLGVSGAQMSGSSTLLGKMGG
jgi:hypothetical protein